MRHVVLVKDRVESRQPELEEVRDRVRNDYLTARRREANEAFFAQLQERYEVEVTPGALPPELAELGGSSGNGDAAGGGASGDTP